jgi:hypothetical protein
MWTFFEPSCSSENTSARRDGFTNSTIVASCLTLLMTSGVAALEMSDSALYPAERTTFGACPACVMDLWFTPSDTWVDGRANFRDGFVLVDFDNGGIHVP